MYTVDTTPDKPQPSLQHLHTNERNVQADTWLNDALHTEGRPIRQVCECPQIGNLTVAMVPVTSTYLSQKCFFSISRITKKKLRRSAQTLLHLSSEANSRRETHVFAHLPPLQKIPRNTRQSSKRLLHFLRVGTPHSRASFVRFPRR